MQLKLQHLQLKPAATCQSLFNTFKLQNFQITYNPEQPAASRQLPAASRPSKEIDPPNTQIS